MPRICPIYFGCPGSIKNTVGHFKVSIIQGYNIMVGVGLKRSGVDWNSGESPLVSVM